MRWPLHSLTRALPLVGAALFIASCTDESPTAPGGTVVYRSPTGLLLNGPPEILIGAGDIVSCSKTDDEKTEALLDTVPGTVFVLGDNVYDNGTTSEFANCYDPSWGKVKSRTKPSVGNHEYNTSNADPYYAYFGAAAGPARKGWYSYDVGGWHIIVLNSNISTKSGTEQDLWLKSDLAAHSNLCTLAYFHHPLYSSTGGSGSGGVSYTTVRPFYDDLYAGGADLVLGGHRHFYERLAPMKPDGSRDNLYGVRQIIAGTGGIGGGTVTNKFPTSEVANGDTRGVLKLYLYPDSYAWKFIPIPGKTFTDSGSTACHGLPGSGTTPAVSASLSTVTASPASITAGGSGATVTVTVKDQNGNAMSGVSVTLAATGTGNTLTQPSSTTNSSGVATGTLSSTVAETKTVSATASGVSLNQTAAVTVTAGAVSASSSTVSASPTSIAVNTGSSTITVTAKDGYGNPVAGATVVLGATGTGNSLTQPAGVTSASGVATGSLSSSVIEAKTVSATINGTAVSQTASVTVTSAPISGSLSTLTASPTTIGAGNGSSTITVTVKDANGVPVSGATVVLSASGAGNTLSQPAGPTDANGVATGTLASTGAGTKTVSATAGGTAITQTASVTVTAGAVSGTQSTVSASPTSIAATTGSATITVTVKDDYGNPISGSTVTLAATGTGNSLTQPGATTSGSGVATGSLSSTDAETKTVSANADGVDLSATAAVTVTSAPPPGTITHTLLTSGNDPTNTKTFTTASIAPAPGALVTIAVVGHNSTAAPTSVTISGGGMTSWTQVASAVYDSASGTHKRVAIFRAMSSAPGSGPITITWPVTVSNSQWIVSQWTGVDQTGTNGAGAVRQATSAVADNVTALAATLAPLSSANNAAYGVLATNATTASSNPGVGFTEIAEVNSGESPRSDLMVEWAVNDATVDANWASSLDAALIAVEIRAAGSP